MEDVEVKEINLIDLIRILWSKLWLIMVSAFLGAVLFLAVTVLFMVPQYETEAMLYVNNSSASNGSSEIIVSGEIDAAKKLVDVYVIICKLPSTLESVIETTGLTMSVEELGGLITAEAVNDTEVFRIRVKHSDPQTAALIANALADILPEKIASIVDGSSVRIMNYAAVPTVRSSPSYSVNTALGAIVGFFISSLIVIIIDFFLDKVKNAEALTSKYKLPVLGEIPDLYDPHSASAKYRYYGYSYAAGSKEGTNHEQ